eukprot:m.307702 g.307702  ORF g.307702 m.307702 type:complete len:428 (+) comp42668_c0_seq1:245-1528(+)
MSDSSTESPKEEKDNSIGGLLERGVNALPIPLWAVIAIVVVVVIVILAICCWCCCRKKKKKKSKASSPDSMKREPRMPKQRVDLQAFRSDMMEAQVQQVQPRETTLMSSGSSKSHLKPGSSLSRGSSLDYSLYEEGEVRRPSVGSPAVGSCGRLRYSVEYDFTSQAVTVIVHDCRNLAAKDRGGTSDPYVKVCILPNKRLKYQTKVHKKTLNPVFNETFVFRDMEYKSIRDRTVFFEVYDFDQITRHDLIGVLTVPFDGLDLANTTSKMEELKEPSKTEGIKDFGEILFALCYLPTATRLQVVIMKARNLKAMDITGKSDPYAKISFMLDGRRIKKKKTSVKRNTLKPVWNESFQFDCPKEKLDRISLVISVVDYDTLGRNDGIGQVEIGPRAKAMGGDHWRHMLEAPRKQLAQWHVLTEFRPLPKK